MALLQSQTKKNITIENNNLKQNMKILPPVIIDKYFEIVIKTRIGQGYFRDGLIKLYNCKCLLYDIDKKQLLFASHIKPWAICNNNEAVDLNNGLLLYPIHDKLFDKGFINFDFAGKI